MTETMTYAARTRSLDWPSARPAFGHNWTAEDLSVSFVPFVLPLLAFLLFFVFAPNARAKLATLKAAEGVAKRSVYILRPPNSPFLSLSLFFCSFLFFFSFLFVFFAGPTGEVEHVEANRAPCFVRNSLVVGIEKSFSE